MHKLLLPLPTRLETGRLYLRCYQAGDGVLYSQAGNKNRQHLQRYESGNAILEARTPEQGEIIVRELALDWSARRHFFLGVFEKATDAFAGQVYVGPVSWETPEFEIGYIADQEHQGRGYITEAVKAALRFVFEDLHAHRASIHCSDTNTRSQRVAERCGFTLEGHTREDHRTPDGELEGSVHYGMLRGEYDNLTLPGPLRSTERPG